MLDIGRQCADGSRTARDRVLLVGHVASPTGFARVLHSLLRYLPARWETHLLGVNLAPGRSDCDGFLHANPKLEETRAETELPRLIERLKPELVLILDEPTACARHQMILDPGRRFRTVLYAAIGSADSFDSILAGKLAGLDSMVTFTEFGRGIVEEAIQRRRRANPGFRFPPIDVIPHGVDTSLFRPLSEARTCDGSSSRRRQARRRLFPDRTDLDDAFIVLNANRNQPFKRLDLTLEGFARFAQNKPRNVKLYLHTATRRPDPGERPLVDRLGIRDRLVRTDLGETHPEIGSEQLNLIYNACDVGLNTSEGEGWGLIAFEHAATRAAQIVPLHSACAELWQDAAISLEPAEVPGGSSLVRQGRTVNAVGVAAALERLYTDRGYLRAMSLAAYERATRPDYRWQSIARVWDAHFARLLRKPA